MIKHMAHVSAARIHGEHHEAPPGTIGICPVTGCGKIILRGHYARRFLWAAGGGLTARELVSWLVIS